MKMIERYMKAMETKDYEALSQLFEEDGIIVDHCASGPAQSEYRVYGREAISMFYRNRFTFGRHSVREMTVIDDRRAAFVADYDGYLVMAIATIRYTSDSGLIGRLSVRPR